nr:EVE domain-containing protein [Candidatus Freyarchaeota archaeon]
MNYWLCITNAENWEVVKNKKVWGVTDRHKNKISQVKPGDILIFYITKSYKVGGIMKADSEPYMGTEKIFSPTGFAAKEIFPNRVKLKSQIIVDKPINFKELVPKLKFIKNKKVWAGSLQGKTMRLIPKEDYETIWTVLA